MKFTISLFEVDDGPHLYHQPDTSGNPVISHLLYDGDMHNICVLTYCRMVQNIGHIADNLYYLLQ